MSVASKNPFALLEEDGVNPPAPEPAPPSTTATDRPSTRGSQRAGRTRGRPGSRGNGYPRGAARTSGPREGAEDEGADDSAGKKVEFTDGGRGRGRSRGRGRGDRDGPRGDREGFRGDREGFRGGGRRDGRRDYDRHSATGKTDSEKKIHQSWGGDEAQTELVVETAAADDAAAEQAAPAENWGAGGGGDDWAAGGGGTEWGTGGNTERDAGGGDTEWGAEGGNADWGAEGGNTDWAPPAPTSTTNAEEPAERSDRRPRDRQEEEPDYTLTLDQYLAQQKEKPSLIPQLETRKIEQDESLWKGAKELAKGIEEDAYFVGKARATPKTRTKKEEKVYLEIDARFERPDRGGRGRGGRGGERGGRGGMRGSRRGGGPRSNGGNTPALNIDDGDAFPSLS